MVRSRGGFKAPSEGPGKVPSGLAGEGWEEPGGPWASVKTSQKLSAAGIALTECWFTRTGGFWVTLCPKFDPKVPELYVQP